MAYENPQIHVNPLGGISSNSQPTEDPGSGDPGGGGYPYGGGGGGGGASSGPTDEQKKAADNLGAVTGYGQKAIKDKAKQGIDALKLANKNNKNARITQTKQNIRNAGNDWYTQQQKLQNVASQLADASGNAMYGSFYQDISDLIARKDDIDDVEVLNQMRENQNQIDNDYFDALAANNNAMNELYLDTEYDLKQLASDYAAQVNNIHPDLAEDIMDADNHTLNIPDWLDTEYYEKHKKDAIDPTTQGLYRPATASIRANDRGLVNTNTSSQYSKSGNSDYWSRVRTGYNRRS